jgi:hypothetical protein
VATTLARVPPTTATPMQKPIQLRTITAGPAARRGG